MLKLIEPVSDLFKIAVDYSTYPLIKQSARYDDDVAHERHRIGNRIAIQMEVRKFSGRDPMAVISFLQ